ncbi:MAG TPA: aminotransferase class I/II-fold pyridoxal phosphate-dependent enzyme, partial [Acidimicrobiales bacterium]|nr:aminotransferase class I/II-fold pyridoxal phosphate-dependent enzyme [Acidimicrobiales bacterium]
NPTTECVDLGWMRRIVDFAREHDVVLVHDFAYADVAFDGYTPPSILQVPGAKDVAVELYTLTKSFSMAGWRVGFLVGNAETVQALTKLKSYLDYGTFQPIQIAAIVAMNEAPDYPKVVNETYQGRRDALCDGLRRIGWEVDPPRGTMFVWAPIPEPYREMGSLEFSKFLVQEGDVATSPGVGFGPGGDGHVRFALIENEQRITQGVRSLRRALTRLR